MCTGGSQSLFELESDSFSDMEAVQKEANAKYQLWKSLYDFMEKSHNWTEDPVLDEAGEQQMSIEAIRGEVEDYAQRAYKMGKAAKEDLVRMPNGRAVALAGGASVVTLLKLWLPPEAVTQAHGEVPCRLGSGCC